jgi:mono/diheme cytochrome c family protein
MRLPSPIQPTSGPRSMRAAAAAVAICAAIMVAGCSSTGGGAAAPAAPAGAQPEALSDPQVREILVNSCFDCHADEGSGSFTAKLAPSYLFGAGKAREVLNFSQWSAMNPKQQREEATEVAKVVESGSMPPGDYDFFHPSAGLSDDQKQLITQWAARQQAVPAH